MSEAGPGSNGRTAMALALAGFIPFLALLLWLAGIDDDHPWRAMTIDMLKTYGAVILSFLGGIRWGLATGRDDATTARILLLSTVPSLAIPANVPVGTHRARAFLFRNGVFIDEMSAPLVIVKSGFEAAIYNMAKTQGLTYGLFAVALAVVTGWLGRLLFRRD